MNIDFHLCRKGTKLLTGTPLPSKATCCIIYFQVYVYFMAFPVGYVGSYFPQCVGWISAGKWNGNSKSSRTVTLPRKQMIDILTFT